MTAFEFDRPSSPGTNRTAAVTECETCGGDRFVQITEREEDEHREVYARCPSCNPDPDGRRRNP